MGKQTDGFNGGFSGRLGNVVGYNWCGQWCVRSLPSVFHDARTERQLAQRSLFAEMVRFAGRVRRVLNISMRVAARNEHVTPSNLFVRLNKQCFAMDGDALAVDYAALRLSEGPVAPVAFDVPQLIDDTTISIAFEKNPEHRNCSQDDEVHLVVYCPELDAFDFSNGFMRRSKRLEMKLNEGWAGKVVHLWGFVVDCAGRASQSTYIGSGILSVDEATQEADGEEIDAAGIGDGNVVLPQTDAVASASSAWGGEAAGSGTGLPPGDAG